ncbi:MAG TPA: heavy-metal-associated domain-containing protein [Kiritimatiellia bacterium]|nr:heavy-metal-associated domain-containing protein [Kiritimatiellia bacterium]
MNRWITLCMLCVMMVTGCRVSDVRTHVVRVPGMAKQEDAEQIRKALLPLNGLQQDKTVFDLSQRKVTVTYDSMMIAHKNIEIAIAEAGYTANTIPAIRPASSN